MTRRTRSPDGGPPPARLARRPVPLAALLLLAATATLRAEDLPAPMTHEAIEARRLHQERLEEHLARDPADRTARIELAEVMAERRFLRDAVRELGRALAADSRYPAARGMDVRRVEAPARRPFVRYDAQVIPNPRCEVAAGDPLRFYYEIYGLARSAEETRRCRIRYRVLNLAEWEGRQPVYPLAYSFDTDEPAGRYDIFTPRVGELDVSALRPGRYELEVRVEDLVSGKTEERKLRLVKRS